MGLLSNFGKGQKSVKDIADEGKKKKLSDTVKDNLAAEDKPINDDAPLIQKVKSASTSSTTPTSFSATPTRTDKELKTIEDKMHNLYKSSQNLPPDEQSYFRQRLEAAKQEYKDNKAGLEKRELAEKLTHAITQLGAGLYGLKSGTDMSGLKFDKTAWDKKYDNSLKELSMDTSTVEKSRAESNRRREMAIQRMNQSLRDYGSFASGRRRGEIQQAQHGDSMKARNREADLRSEDLQIQKEKQAAQKSTAAHDRLVRDWGSLMMKLQDDKKIAEPKLALSEVRRQATQLGMSEKEFEAIADDATDSWWGMDADDVVQIAASVNEKLSTASPATPPQSKSSSPKPETVERLGKDGVVYIYDAKTKELLGNK